MIKKLSKSLIISIIGILGMVAIMAVIAGIYLTGYFREIIFILAIILLIGFILAWKHGEL